MDISLQRNMGGARLAYVVKPIDGEVMRPVMKWDKVKGLVSEIRAEPAGFMVYFPRGHAIRMSKEDLAHYGLDGEPPIINMKDLYSPNSPLGKLMNSQDEVIRKKGYGQLEEMVMRLATAKTGSVLMPEQLRKQRPGE